MKVSHPSTRKKMTMKEFAALVGIPYKTFHFRLTSGYTVKDACHLTEVEARSKAKTRHGMWGTVEYVTWESMINRCRHHPHYIKLGIKVCPRWEKFENFYADMGPKPAGLTLERIDGTKGYEPGNCKWATWLEQSQNTSRNVYLTENGARFPVSEWARRKGLPYGRLLYRAKNNFNLQDAFYTGIHGTRRK